MTQCGGGFELWQVWIFSQPVPEHFWAMSAGVSGRNPYNFAEPVLLIYTSRCQAERASMPTGGLHQTQMAASPPSFGFNESEVGPGICISSEFPGDADAAGS